VDKFTKLDLNSITSNNRMNIFNCILEAKEINRAVIAKKVGLSIPAVMSITDDLIQKGIIYVIGKGKSSGGKRPHPLAFPPFRGLTIFCRDIPHLLSCPVYTESARDAPEFPIFPPLPSVSNIS